MYLQLFCFTVQDYIKKLQLFLQFKCCVFRIHKIAITTQFYSIV